MGILFYGKCPSVPLHEFDGQYSKDLWLNCILPGLTDEPLAVDGNGEPVRCALAECRGDWKFVKAGLHYHK